MKHIYRVLIIATLISCGKGESPKPETQKPEPKPNKPDVENNDPTITGFSPESAEAGQTVTITGTDFGTSASAVKVKFADGDDITPGKVTNTIIEVNVPESAKTALIAFSIGSKPQMKTTKEFTVVIPDPKSAC